MRIREARPADSDTLLDLWLRAVRATHAFLSESEIQNLLPHVRDYLRALPPEFVVLASGAGQVLGFMGMTGSKIDSLFLAPEFHGQGGGRRLIEHALQRHPELTVDVNEQNPGACRFYEACGFVVDGRSETDEAGRPYPILHLRRPASPMQ